MAIAKRPNRGGTDIARPDPMEFIQGASRPPEQLPEPDQNSLPAVKKRKEPVIIRFDDETLSRVDRAASKRGLSRAALVRMLVIENLVD
ncbi:MAG: hypothetical protein JO212_09440 [Acetobacteraceae bacterium]|nr:hypothetical protein [Acetobacteraceae bacterium]MBV8590267.1 hypothetical protein [Acetobacteraceae bacterium]